MLLRWNDGPIVSQQAILYENLRSFVDRASQSPGLVTLWLFKQCCFSSIHQKVCDFAKILAVMPSAGLCQLVVEESYYACLGWLFSVLDYTCAPQHIRLVVTKGSIHF